MKPSDAAVALAGAWRVGHHQQIPAIIQNISRVAHDMAVGAIFTRQEVAGPRIMATGQKGVAHGAGKFAGDQDAHGGLLVDHDFSANCHAAKLVCGGLALM